MLPLPEGYPRPSDTSWALGNADLGVTGEAEYCSQHKVEKPEYASAELNSN